MNGWAVKNAKGEIVRLRMTQATASLEEGETCVPVVIQEAGSGEVAPIAWLHNDPDRIDVCHTRTKEIWLGAWPKQVEHYTIPLYAHPPASADEGIRILKLIAELEYTENGMYTNAGKVAQQMAKTFLEAAAKGRP